MVLPSSPHFQTQITPTGIALLTFDQKTAPTNQLNWEALDHYLEAATALLAQDEVQGLVVTSAKNDFITGAHPSLYQSPSPDKAALLQRLMDLHQRTIALEQQGKPIVAALNGTALGLGYELALTCHYRLAVSDEAIRIGLPQISFGVLPGYGGTQRLVRLLGLAPTIELVLYQHTLSPKQAFKLGLVDGLVGHADALLPAAVQWIEQHPNTEQPWDHPRYNFPDGGPYSPPGQRTLSAAIAKAHQRYRGLYPNVQHALACWHDGAGLPLWRGLEVEARFFIQSLHSAEAQNLLRTKVLGIQQAQQHKAPALPPVQKMGLLGAGMMGAGIAYAAAQAGLEVYVQDRDLETAQKASQYTQQRLDKQVQQRRLSPAQAQTMLQRIHPVSDLSEQEDLDWIIEAVFESESLKHRVLADLEGILPGKGYLASNTSTLPISGLAQPLKDPERFLGLHFFSPVEKMPLVEIIVGKKTSPAAVEAARQLVLQLDKVPIVVQDGRGFFTSRVFSTYTQEGALLLREGTPPALLEHAAQQAGMPVGPLAVLDEISLTLAHQILSTTQAEHTWAQRQFFDLLHAMIHTHQRPGRQQGAGFYDYPNKAGKSLWSGLPTTFPPDPQPLSLAWIQKRLMYIMALEAYRCLEEGILATPTDGDVGSLLGWGFPAHTGGVFSYMDGVGIRQFVADCDLLERCCGPRFRVPDALRERAVEGQSFYPQPLASK